MITFKFFILPTKRPSLRLRITNNRKITTLSLRVRMQEDVLRSVMLGNQAKYPLESRIISAYSAKLDMIRFQLISEGRSNEDVHEIRKLVEQTLFPDMVLKEEVADVTKKSFGLFFRDYCTHIKAKSTRKGYTSTLSRIEEFCPDVDKLTFEDLSFKWLTDFDNFLAASGNMVNTRGFYLRHIKTVVYNAISNELTTKNPFLRFKIRKEATRKRSVPVEVLREIFTFKPDEKDEYAHDMFKLIFFLIGINVKDLYNLKNIEYGRIEYIRAKTGRKYSIKLEPEAAEIIEKYKGSVNLINAAERWKSDAYFGKHLNRKLSRLGASDGAKDGRWPYLTTYWARHSWSTIARYIGVSVDDIGLSLGHADTGHSTTMIYIEDDYKKIDIANRKVIDFVLYGKK